MLPKLLGVLGIDLHNGRKPDEALVGVSSLSSPGLIQEGFSLANVMKSMGLGRSDCVLSLFVITPGLLICNITNQY